MEGYGPYVWAAWLIADIAIMGLLACTIANNVRVRKHFAKFLMNDHSQAKYFLIRFLSFIPGKRTSAFVLLRLTAELLTSCSLNHSSSVDCTHSQLYKTLDPQRLGVT